mgnify:CR=1 FL=1
MKYLTTSQIAEKWGLTERRIRMMCQEGKIEGTFLVGKTWNIPEDAEKPKRVNAKSVSPKNKLKEILSLKEELDHKRPLTEAELKRLNEEFMIEYTYNSNAIEGSTLTLKETSLVLQGITINKKPLKEHLEAIGHKDAFYYVCDLVREKTPLTESIIKQIHSLVLVAEPQNRGVYRKLPVRILGANHTPPQPYLVPKQMEDLMINYKKWIKTKNIVEVVSLLHLNFEFIHPFIDGNGRTGRLLVNLVLMQNGFPPIDIKFSDRQRYYDCFEDFATSNKPTAMIDLISDLLIQRLKEYLNILSSIS